MLKLFRPTLQWYVLREFLILFLLTVAAMSVFMLILLSYWMATELEHFGANAGQVLMLAPFIYSLEGSSHFDCIRIRCYHVHLMHLTH